MSVASQLTRFQPLQFLFVAFITDWPPMITNLQDLQSGIVTVLNSLTEYRLIRVCKTAKRKSILIFIITTHNLLIKFIA